MNQIQLAIQLDQLIQAGPTVFLKIEPEIIDLFQSGFSTKLTFMARAVKVEIELNDNNLTEILALVKAALFEDSTITVIGWNLKNLFTLVLSKTGLDIDFSSKILDLKIAESFIGIRSKPPIGFNEMVERLKVVISDDSWLKFKNIYQKVYSPLLTRVIPKIEIEGVLDTDKRQILFPYYEIEGTVNARMSCQVPHKHSFNPHSLMPLQRPFLQPKGQNLVFLSFDYHFMEVCMLAWLSKDEVLMELLSKDVDFYQEVYRLIFDKVGDTKETREFCKDHLFLPTVYGQSAKALAEGAGLAIATAENLLTRLKMLFATLFKWVENYKGEGSVYTDYVGHKRHFAEKEEYKYRNFIIQSPSAIFCLEKLIHLYNELKDYAKIVAHIHDEYIIACAEKQVDSVKSICIRSLTSESEIFKGLKLKVNFKISKTLA